MPFRHDMAESWRERLNRQSRDMDAALRGVLAAAPADDTALRAELEALAAQPRFAEFTWLWGPVVAQRNRVLFRPFILAHFSSLTLNAKGDWFDAWKGETASGLERWLNQCDTADDIELTRRLYGWKLTHADHKDREARWRRDVVARFSAAQSPAARFTALAKVDTGWLSLDAKTALELYAIDPTPARPFILHHLPYFGWGGEKRPSWEPLLQRSRDNDPDFHFDLYRRVADQARWRADVLEQARTTRDPAALDAELERRHPRSYFEGAAEVFYELVRMRERDVVPYVMRHIASVFPRWGFIGKREAKGLPNLLQLADGKGWLDLWAALLRTGATQQLFDAEVKRLVRSKTLGEAELRTRLSLVAGPGREANFPGVSFAQVHPLDEDTALELYTRLPSLVRGPYRMHVGPSWHTAYPKLTRAAIAAGDRELIDFLASRAGIQQLTWGDGRGWKETIDALASHFEAMPEAEFVQRAANALSRMPAFAVWNYDQLLRTNRLARLLFERSTLLYLSDASAVRDLLESPQIHVQVLAFRILGSADPRACVLAAQNVDLLQAALFRPLHRRTRLEAFKALENAAHHDADAARYLLGRMREALALPEKRYPTEKLIGLIGKVLHRWPALRGPREVPRIYGELDA